MACLQHYAAQKGQFSLQEHRLLQQYFRTSGSNTYRRWIVGQINPVGENLIRIIYLAEFLGYRVAELGMMEKPIQDLGRLIAFGVISPEQAVEACGLTRDHFLKVFSGRGGTQDVVLEKARHFANPHQHRLGDVQPLYAQLRIKGSAQNHPDDGNEQQVSAAPRRGEIETGTHPDRTETIQMLALALKVALPLAERIVSGDFSADDRRELRQLAGNKTVFKLSNVLISLCSEEARRSNPDPIGRRESV